MSIGIQYSSIPIMTLVFMFGLLTRTYSIAGGVLTPFYKQDPVCEIHNTRMANSMTGLHCRTISWTSAKVWMLHLGVRGLFLRISKCWEVLKVGEWSMEGYIYRVAFGHLYLPE